MTTPFSTILRGLCPLAVGAAGVAFATGHVQLGGILLVLWSACELITVFSKPDSVTRKRDTQVPLRR